MATIKDVAESAGVSIATVSYALRSDPRIAEHTADKVRAAAEHLHYAANLSARSLRLGKSGVIGVAVYELNKPYPSEMSAAISREANRLGFEAIVQQTSSHRSHEISILRNVTSQLCDATIFSPGKVTAEEIAALGAGKPILLLDMENSLFDSVFTPSEEGAEAAVRHLVGIGCRRIGILGAYHPSRRMNLKSDVVQRRLHGIKKAFDESNMELAEFNFIPSLWDMESARRAVDEVLSRKPSFDGLFCMTDTVALGAIRGFNDHGIKVPSDIAVIGFDGIEEGKYSIPSLSTVKTDIDDLARKAVSLLIDRLNAGQSAKDVMPVRSLTASYDLVQRESTTV